MATKRRLTDDEATEYLARTGRGGQEIKNILSLRALPDAAFTNLLRSGAPMGTARTQALSDPNFLNPNANGAGGAANPSYLGNRSGLQLPDTITRTESGGLLRLPFAQPREAAFAARNQALDPVSTNRGPSLRELRAAPGPAVQQQPSAASQDPTVALLRASGMSEHQALITVMRSRTGGGVSANRAGGQINAAQTAQAQATQQFRADQQRAEELQLATTKATAPIEAAKATATGAMQRATANIEANKETARLQREQYNAALAAQGKVVGSPEWQQQTDADLAKAEAAGDGAMQNIILKAKLESLTTRNAEGYVTSTGTPDQIDRVAAGKQANALPPSRGDVQAAEQGSADLNGDGSVSAEEATVNKAATILEKDDARVKAGQPPLLTPAERMRAEEDVRAYKTKIRKPAPGTPQKS